MYVARILRYIWRLLDRKVPPGYFAVQKWLEVPENNGSLESLVAFEDSKLQRSMPQPSMGPDALADFTYRSGHVELLRRRREFFEAPDEPILCLWWIPEGTLPTAEEAVARLDHLRAHGPSPLAFTFRHRFPPGSAEAQVGDSLDVCPA